MIFMSQLRDPPVQHQDIFKHVAPDYDMRAKGAPSNAART
jgi:hypothetical protein